MIIKKLILIAILGLTLAIGSANAAVIFKDDFDSYTGGSITTLELASGGVWVTPGWGTGPGGSDVKVGGPVPSVAYFSNNYYGDAIRFCTVTTETGLSDYTVSVKAWAKWGTTTALPCWYAAGRVSGPEDSLTYIVAGAGVSDGQVYLDLKESTGTEPSGMWYVADWDPNQPIYIDLTLSGNTVTATVTHIGYSQTQSYTTSILGAGAFGFAGHNPWGYAVGSFDNFVSNTEHSMWSQAALARSKIALGDDPNAQAAIDKLITDFAGHPDLPEAIFSVGEEYCNKAYEYKNQGLLAEAEEYFQKALTVLGKIITELPASTTTVDAYYLSAGCYFFMDEYEKAIDYFKRTLDNWPDYGRAWKALFLTIQCYEKLEKAGRIPTEEAAAQIRQACERLLADYPDCIAAKSARNLLEHWGVSEK